MMWTRTLGALIFFLVNLLFNYAFNNNEEAYKILFYQVIAITTFAISHWLTEKGIK